jgi:hypothetical protein
MRPGESALFPEVVTEAIVVVDLVESTTTSNLFGWYAVGRGLMRELRALITQVSYCRGLRCLKSMGDGYLLTFGDVQSAEMAAVHAVVNDREGPHVSYAFRLEAISRASLPSALNPLPPEQLPVRDYVLCSEEVAGILSRRSERWYLLSIGLFKLKGFPGWREVFQVLPKSANETERIFTSTHSAQQT